LDEPMTNVSNVYFGLSRLPLSPAAASAPRGGAAGARRGRRSSVDRAALGDDAVAGARPGWEVGLAKARRLVAVAATSVTGRGLGLTRTFVRALGHRHHGDHRVGARQRVGPGASRAAAP
jgi:hypothetical protein